MKRSIKVGNTTYELMDVPEVARILGVCEDTVRQKLRDGQLRGKKLKGTEWSIFADSVKEYIERGTDQEQ